MKINYCIECTMPLTKHSDTHYTCANGHAFWNNPKTAVILIPIRGKKILCTRRAMEPKKGLCSFVGGFMEYGETVEQALRRETMEETGIVPGELVLLSAATHDYVDGVWVASVIFVTRDFVGEPTPQDDVAELLWKPIDFIDSGEFAWRFDGLTDKLKAYMAV